MPQAKHIESSSAARDSDTAGDLALVLKVARRLAIRTGDERVVSCMELALHLLKERRADSRPH